MFQCNYYIDGDGTSTCQMTVYPPTPVTHRKGKNNFLTFKNFKNIKSHSSTGHCYECHSSEYRPIKK